VNGQKIHLKKGTGVSAAEEAKNSAIEERRGAR
jgi:hypothetical protein